MPYTVTLLDAPDLSADQRASLEAEFRDAIDAQYGGHAEAAGALFAWRDGSVDDHIRAGGSPLLWVDAEDDARLLLADRVPAGARFDVALVWPKA